MKTLVINTALTVTLLFVLSACNTMEGVGRDVQKAGEWIEKKAD
ncbi:entericidin A/B family lipoprotein [Terasakiella pusilla]|jgi:predicted small secreted protein|nr:entericidin A/B family lipoprotein [Terasakiella pusilla]